MRKALILLLLLSIYSLTLAQEKQRVAIYMSGTEPPGTAGVHKVVGGELAKAISRSDKYAAVDRTDAILGQLSKEHEFQRSGAVDDAQIKALGRQFGVQYLCIAEISALRGGLYYLDVRLVDVVTAQIVGTATAGSDFSGGKKMMRAAWRVAGELAGVETKAVKPKKPTFYVGIGLDAIGAGLIAYGIYQNSSAAGNIDNGGYKDGAAYESAKKAVGNRDAGYVAGAALILSGISVTIFF